MQQYVIFNVLKEYCIPKEEEEEEEEEEKSTGRTGNANLLIGGKISIGAQVTESHKI